VSSADLLKWAALAASRRDTQAVLRDAVAARFGLRHAFLTSTGRAGMTILLRAMRTLAPAQKTDVVLPSYTCFSVAASVVKAGLRPRIVDIDPATLDYEAHALKETDVSRVLAVVATNLYGLPNDLPALSTLARQNGVFLIDDAAQAMGASVAGRASGTWGDAGLFSLDKGKNVSAIDGGIVVTNSDQVASALAAEMRTLTAPRLSEAASGVLKALVYSLMLRPWLYWIPNRVPQLKLGQTVFTTDFPLEQPSRALSGLGSVMLPHLDEFTDVRTRNAAALLEGLRSIPGVQTIAPRSDAVPVYLRLPILIADTNARRRAFAALESAGIGATGSYPASLADVRELQSSASIGSATGGRYVADHIVTLPTHPFVSGADIERTIDALADTTRGASAVPACAVSA
jgi:dTDP-4-amino-4,6-dideoxygalactose transaminase